GHAAGAGGCGAGALFPLDGGRQRAAVPARAAPGDLRRPRHAALPGGGPGGCPPGQRDGDGRPVGAAARVRVEGAGTDGGAGDVRPLEVALLTADGAAFVVLVVRPRGGASLTVQLAALPALVAVAQALVEG